MLQQTRVDTVVPYYQRFLERFPRVESLAEAPLETVLSEWSGLGYYRRARMLHAAAKVVVERHGGRFPRTADVLRSLPGVGRYTAGAIASIAWGEKTPLVDGNVARVMARLYALEEDPTRGAGHANVWSIAHSLVPDDAPGDFNQALMELGATVCTPRVPRCRDCPLFAVCRARQRGLENELPRIAAKERPVERSLAALVVRTSSGVLLARRHEGGLFGGLWEPPAVGLDPAAADGAETAPKPRRTRAPKRALLGRGQQAELGEILSGVDSTLANAFHNLLGVTPTGLTDRGSVVHVLSHRRFTVRVVEGTLSARDARAARLADTTTYDTLRIVGQSDLERLPQSTMMRRVLAAADGRALK